MNIRSRWPDRGVVWRWHFYAGLFCIPFVVVLAASGTVYLFKAELEAWLDRHHDRLAAAGPARAPAERVAAALAALPGGRLKAYELPVPRGGSEATTATRVLVDRAGETQRVYVHPGSLAVLAVVPERDRLMRRVFRLHGELWLGEHGSHLVELAASWTIVMILTGLVLWWPRQARGFAGVLYPRLRAGRRTAWRDLHAVTGVWISAATLFFLASGLPWAAAWGSYLDLLRRVTGTAAVGQDWSHRRADRGTHAGHEAAGTDAAAPLDGAALDRVVAAAGSFALDPPVLVAPPRGSGRGWSVKSETANRPRRAELVVDGASGAVVSRRDFRDRHLVDRIVGYGIAAHEGRLFGWPNQLLGLLTAGGLVLVAVSGAVMWWRRRSPGTLGAPPAPDGAPRRGGPLAIGAVILLAAWLPLFGTSLLAVVLVERLVLRRVPGLRDWLGLAG